MSSETIEKLEKVAKVLVGLAQQVVFTGGATIPLYLDAYEAEEIRPTDDVDCVVEVVSKADYYRLAEKLRELGLSEDTSKGAPLCRWLCQGVKLDMMPINPDILGFGNRWYEPGVREAIRYMLPNGSEIWIFTVSYALGAKIEAFQSRGNNQPYYSKDFEDIVMLLNGCPRILEEVNSAEREIKKFVVEWIQKEKKNLDNIAPAFLSGGDRVSGRGEYLLEVIDQLSGFNY